MIATMWIMETHPNFQLVIILRYHRRDARTFDTRESEEAVGGRMHRQALTACGVNSPSGDLELPSKPLAGGPYTGFFSFLFFKSKDACHR